MNDELRMMNCELAEEMILTKFIIYNSSFIIFPIFPIRKFSCHYEQTDTSPRVHLKAYHEL